MVTPCLRLSRTCFSSEVRKVLSNTGPDQSNRSIMAEYEREGCAALSSHCAQSLHICLKGNIQTISLNTHQGTLTPNGHCANCKQENKKHKKGKHLAEYGRDGCVELSSHCVQSLHICPKGNAQTSYGW